MAKIVVITSGLTGILHASFELVARLEAAGHSVIYACPKAVGEKVQAQGFDYVQLPAVNYFPEPELPILKGKLQKISRLYFKWKNKKSRQRVAVASLGMEEFTKTIENLNPNLWILDVELHEHIMTLVAKKKRVLLLSQWFSLWHRKGLPPLLQDTIPGENWRGNSMGLAFAWWKIKRQRWWIFWKKKIRSGGTNRRSVLKNYAQKIGFPKRYILENYWPGPFVYGELPVMNMTALELEFPHDIRPNSHYIGPMVFENRVDIQTNIEVDERLETIFKIKKETGKKLIYCSVSTYRKGDKTLLKKITEAVRGRDNWILILGLGGMLETDFLQPLPENVHAFGWIPQLKVLAQADLSINHGGIHTINECVHFGVPMLVYSGKKSDQNGCAARVHFHKIGMMADKDLDDVETIENKINSVLTEENYRKNVKNMREDFNKYKTENRLNKIVNQFLN